VLFTVIVYQAKEGNIVVDNAIKAGELLRHERKAREITQDVLSMKALVDRKVISQLENGVIVASLEDGGTLDRIGRVFGDNSLRFKYFATYLLGCDLQSTQPAKAALRYQHTLEHVLPETIPTITEKALDDSFTAHEVQEIRQDIRPIGVQAITDIARVCFATPTQKNMPHAAATAYGAYR